MINERGHTINGEPHNHAGCEKCYADLWASFKRLQKDYLGELGLRQRMVLLLALEDPLSKGSVPEQT